MLWAVHLFSKLNKKTFLDTLILKIYFLMVKIDNFRGELSDMSAENTSQAVGAHQREHCARLRNRHHPGNRELDDAQHRDTREGICSEPDDL